MFAFFLLSYKKRQKHSVNFTVRKRLNSLVAQDGASELLGRQSRQTNFGSYNAVSKKEDLWMTNMGVRIKKESNISAI